MDPIENLAKAAIAKMDQKGSGKGEEPLFDDPDEGEESEDEDDEVGSLLCEEFIDAVHDKNPKAAWEALKAAIVGAKH